METLEEKIRYKFNNKNYLYHALTHSSYSNENKADSSGNNERLEFLGDAVLELTISDYIFNAYPKMPEGEMTKLRASVVCEPMLAKIAKQIDIGDKLRLGRGEAITGGRTKNSILADAFEALIGAIYLDSGLDSARTFVMNMMEADIIDMKNKFKMSDCKTYLQEIIQKDSKSQLEYVIVSEKGPEHNKIFVAHVIHESRILGKGQGKTKKEAEQNAAMNAINVINIC